MRLESEPESTNIIDLRKPKKVSRKEMESAINETLRLADFLNDAASRGAGFVEHWGERVMQAVEPLRNINAFAGETLIHNRVLLDYNGKLLEKIHELEKPKKPRRRRRRKKKVSR